MGLTMGDESLRVTDGERGLRALLLRVRGLDDQATVRFRQLDENTVDCFATTPFSVLASRRVRGSVSRDGACVGVVETLAALEEGASDVGPPRDAAWPGALPPATGFTLVDDVPVTVARELADQGRALARQFSGPLGPPKSLLDQTVITTEKAELKAHVPMRMIFTCTSLGLIPGAAVPLDVPRHMRVSTLGKWVRLDAPFGSAYYAASGLTLL